MSDENLNTENTYQDEVFSYVKSTLHISHSLSDTEIKAKIKACFRDMERVGVDITVEDESLMTACELYAKWLFNYNNQAESFKACYEELRDALSLTEKYGIKEGDENATTE